MKQIPIHKISFAKADGYAVTEQDVLRRKLTRLHLYGTQFAYTAFNPELKDTVLRTGTPHADSKHPNSIDCCIVDLIAGEKDIRDNEEYDLPHYLDVTSKENNAMFAVYDKSKLVERVAHPYYQFKEPDKKLEALLAVVEVTW